MPYIESLLTLPEGKANVPETLDVAPWTGPAPGINHMSTDTAKLEQGKLVSQKVTDRVSEKIEKGKLVAVKAIVVHQTGGASAASSLASYKDGKNGAHFLVDKDGTIYQTARVDRVCWHVGKIRSRCHQLKSCSADELKSIEAILFHQKQSYAARVTALHEHESAKAYPDRYPTNADSLGIELVSAYKGDKGYEPTTEAQNNSLKWLVATLEALLGLGRDHVYRHPDVSYKQETEAKTATWR